MSGHGKDDQFGNTWDDVGGIGVLSLVSLYARIRGGHHGVERFLLLRFLQAMPLQN